MAKVKKTAVKPKASAPKKTTKPAGQTPAAGKKRTSWLNRSTNSPMIEQHARRLESFLAALADGVVEESEVKAQEQRLVELMREIEPQLDDALHEKVTRLLCELTAYDLMQVLHSMHAARPKRKFRG